jgi:hypothetical protein
MRAPALELSDIFRLHGPAYLMTFGDSLSHEQKRALRAIAICRTAALGGHVDQCDQCGYRKISYCSCRNRHCPKCHGHARARWLEERATELLPVEYFYVVFTLPQLVAPLALQNQQLVYGLFFRAAAETRLQISSRLARLNPQTRRAATGVKVEKGAIRGGSGGTCAPCSGDNDSTKTRQTRSNAKATRGTSRRYSTAGGEA